MKIKHRYIIKNKNENYLEFKENHISDAKKVFYHFYKNEFKKFIKKNYDINIHRIPDEAIIIIKENNVYIKIIEKKNQNVEGSVEDKLKTGSFNRSEYEIMFNKCKMKDIIFIIEYAFCISKFLEDKLESSNIKYIIMGEIIKKDNIKIFYGDNINYFNNIYNWCEIK